MAFTTVLTTSKTDNMLVRYCTDISAPTEDVPQYQEVDSLRRTVFGWDAEAKSERLRFLYLPFHGLCSLAMTYCNTTLLLTTVTFSVDVVQGRLLQSVDSRRCRGTCMTFTKFSVCCESLLRSRRRDIVRHGRKIVWGLPG